MSADQPFLLSPPTARPCVPRVLGSRRQSPTSASPVTSAVRSSSWSVRRSSAIPEVQIVCNSELDAADVAVSKHVRETALKERWNEAPSEVEALLHRDRYRSLHELLTSGRVEIRVVPKDRVFVHGKAGVIEAADGARPAFSDRSTRPRAPLPRTTKSYGKIPHRKAWRGSRRSSTHYGGTPIRSQTRSSKRSSA